MIRLQFRVLWGVLPILCGWRSAGEVIMALTGGGQVPGEGVAGRVFRCPFYSRSGCSGVVSGYAGSADGGQQPQVPGDSGEEELAGGVVQAAQAEAAQADAVLEAGVESLDVGGAALAEGAALGGAQPVR